MSYLAVVVLSLSSLLAVRYELSRRCHIEDLKTTFTTMKCEERNTSAVPDDISVFSIVLSDRRGIREVMHLREVVLHW